jgi:hypothetical protein
MASFTAIQIDRMLSRMSIDIEECFQWLSDDLSVGDDGVAEALVSIQNSISLAQGRLKKKLEA